MRRTTGWTAFKITTGLRENHSPVIRYILVPPMPEVIQRLEVNKVLKKGEDIVESYPADRLLFGESHIDVLTFGGNNV